MGKAIMEGMIGLGLLELVIKFSDWLLELLGGSGSMKALNSDMGAAGNKLGSKVKSNKMSGKQIEGKVGAMKEGGSALKGGLGKVKAKFGRGK